jgi:hypothetical protein
MAVQPWWEHLTLRDEVQRAQGNVNDVQMSLFRTVHKADLVPYSDPAYYSDITYPTHGLVDLLARVAVRLGTDGNQAARPVWRGDQAMGGGKSHGLVGLYHLARTPTAFAKTPLGQQVWTEASKIAGEDLPADLNDPIVIVLSCDELDPFVFDNDVDGIAKTLAERWLWRLVEEDTARFKKHRDQLGTKEGIVEILEAIGRPVLTLVDEILDYVQAATTGGETAEGTHIPGFTRRLFEATTRTPNAATVIVMISSEDDKVSLSGAGEAVRADLEGQMTRFASVTTTSTGADFANIVRRRLFVNEPAAGVVKATAKAWTEGVNVLSGWKGPFGEQPWWRGGAWDGEVARCYPFHPDLMALVGGDWARQAGFQKVRSTLQIFSAAVWTLAQRAAADEWVPLLIGIGDLPMSDAKTREAVTNSGVVADPKTQANFREIAIADVVNDTDDAGAARLLDLNREGGSFTTVNPRAAERMATAIFLTSLTPRAQGVVGATEAELACAAFVPDPACSMPTVELIRSALEDPGTGLATIEVQPGSGSSPRRFRLSTKMTLRMLVREQEKAVFEEDGYAYLRQLADAEKTSGPFDIVKFISAEDLDVKSLAKGKELTDALVRCLADSGVDDANKRRLYVLDPSGFTLLNGQDSETRVAIGAALGLTAPAGTVGYVPAPLPVAWPASAVFVCVNTFKRRTALTTARRLVAHLRVAELQAVSSDPSAEAEIKRLVADLKKKTTDQLRAAFQHIVYVNESIDASGNRTRILDGAKTTSDAESALNGTHVWAHLADANVERAFPQGGFDAAALLRLLDDHNDWGKPLSELRNAFYKTPRLPLLYDGDQDLQRAIFAAVSQDKLRVVTPAGVEATVGAPGEINLASSHRLERPGDALVIVPDFSGLDVEVAVVAVEDAGLVAQVSGAGRIVSQVPDAGTPVPPGQLVTLAASNKEPKPKPPKPGDNSAVHEVVFSLMGETFTQAGRRDAYYHLLQRLAEAIEATGTDSAGFLQMQLKLTAGPTHVSAIADAAEEAGIKAQTREVP